MAWKIAECSESTGRTGDASALSASLIRSEPATTSDSLFASAKVFPARTAARTAGKPAATDDGGEDDVHIVARGDSTIPVCPKQVWTPNDFSSATTAASGSPAMQTAAGRAAAGLFQQLLAVVAERRQSRHAVVGPQRRDDFHGVAAD
jgi:hypothetical protein